MATISKGIELLYSNGGEEGEFFPLTNLQEIPDLGGEVEAVEITTLADEAHKYTDGLKNYGDSLEFKFLYKKEQFETLQGLVGVNYWRVVLPDSTKCTFGGTCSVKLAGAGVGTVLTYSLAIKPSTDMVWA